MDELLRIGKSLGGGVSGLAGGARASQGPSPQDKELESFWTTLTRMSETDPEAYKAYLERMMRESQATQASPPVREILPTPGFCVGVVPKGEVGYVEDPPGRPPRQVRPPWFTPGMKLYINLCFSDRLASPVLPQGKKLADLPPGASSSVTLQDLYNLNIPVAVSPLRPCTTPNSLREAAAIDIVVHPCIQAYLEREGEFRKEYTAFAIKSVEDELLVTIPPLVWVEEPVSRRYMGGGEGGKIIPLPIAPPPPAVSEALGLGKGGGKKGGSKGPSGVTPTSSPTITTTTDDLTQLLRALDEGSGSLPPSTKGAMGGALEELSKIGERLEGEVRKQQQSDPPQTQQSEGGGSSASSFAAFAATSLPIQALLYSEGVERQTCDVEREEGGGSCSTTLVTTLTFSPSLVDTLSKEFMAVGDLELDATSLTFSLPPSHLPGYKGLSIPLVPLAKVTFPPGLQALPSSAQAKYSKKTGTLKVRVGVK
jgi:hypothetical protein